MKIALNVSAYRIEIGIFLLALLLRIALFSINLHVNNGNFIETVRATDGYYEISQNLLLGNGYSDNPPPEYKPNALRPPVWIYIITGFAWLTGSYKPALAFELIIGSLIPILGMYLARRVVSPRLATLTGIFLAIEPNTVFFSTLFATETCFTFLLLTFSMFVFRYIEQETTRHAVWAGVFLGLAILIKPTVQFLPVVIPVAVAYIFRKKLSRAHLTHALCFIGVTALLVAPWLYRNHIEFGGYGISAQAPFNLYTVLVPTVLAIDNGTSFETERNTFPLPPHTTGADITPGNGAYFTKQSLTIISHHKIAMLKSMGISAFTFFTHDGMLSILGNAGVVVPNMLNRPALTLLFTQPLSLGKIILSYIFTPGIFILIGRGFWILFTILFFIGIGSYYKKEPHSLYALYTVLLVAYFTLFTAVNGFGMNARFRTPIDAFIAMFALYGASMVWHFIKNQLQSRHA